MALHSVGASAVLVAALLTGASAAVVGILGGRGWRWVNGLRSGLVVFIAVEAGSGAGLLFLYGARPHESLHLLYGVLALAILPLAGAFASEAPPAPRAWILVGACLLLLAVAWRLASTG